MFKYAEIDSRFVRALANPTRLAILNALRERPMTASQLAVHLEISRASAGYHARRLAALGFVVVRSTAERRSVEPIFHLVVSPQFEDDAWGAMPAELKDVTVATALAQMHAAAVSAASRAGFARSDVHLSRTALRLTQDEWLALSKEMRGWLDRLLEARDESARNPRGNPHEAIDATAILMLFETPGGGSPPTGSHDLPACDADEDELVTRAYAIHEDLDRLLIREPVDWQRVTALVDELRVLSQAQLARGVREADAPAV